ALGQDTEGNDVFLKDIWPTAAEVQEIVDSSISREQFIKQYATVFDGDERWTSLPTPTGPTFEWNEDSTYVRKAPYFDGMTMELTPVADITGARVMAALGDSVTTDHISPAGAARPGARHHGGRSHGAAGRLRDDRPHLAGRCDQAGHARCAVPAGARRRAEGLQLLRLPPRQPRGHDPRHVREHPSEEHAGQ